MLISDDGFVVVRQINMEIKLHNLKSFNRKNRKRVGRGNASGHGTYSGRGLKGQRARAGGKSGLKRMGLKSFLQQIPKVRGFKSYHPRMQIVQLRDLDKRFKENELITLKQLFKAGLIKSIVLGVKILGPGKLSKKLIVKANKFSKSAENAIKKAGGKIELIRRE